MAVNKYVPHLYVIPEDDANRQMAVGFEKDYRIRARAIQILRPAGGWKKALDWLSDEYYRVLDEKANSRVLVLIDCDQDVYRIAGALDSVPEHLKDRVFILGAMSEPEKLKQELNLTFEKIGEEIANACFDDGVTVWNHDQLKHNASEVERLRSNLFSVVFEG